VVVEAGLTAREDPLTVPTPGARLRVVAPVTLQARVLDWPAVTVGGVAVKALMAGGLAGGVVDPPPPPPPPPQARVLPMANTARLAAPNRVAPLKPTSGDVLIIP
jgi:hypothetical protein